MGKGLLDRVADKRMNDAETLQSGKPADDVYPDVYRAPNGTVPKTRGNEPHLTMGEKVAYAVSRAINPKPTKRKMRP